MKRLAQKLCVFLAHSFDTHPPEWSTISDTQVARFFEDLLKNLGWKVLSGKILEARRIDDKIAEAVNSSQAVLAIFTGKHRLDSDRLLPSPWVLCECAFARGRFEGSDYIVAGFREKGIEPKELAMLTISGMEFPEFDRSSLAQDKTRFANYLKDLESRIIHGTSDQLVMFRQAFRQTKLHKIFLVYRNGYCTVQNITELVIHDPDTFLKENGGVIHHHIWNYQHHYPPLSEMVQNPIHLRKSKPFFYAKIDWHGNKKLDSSLPVWETHHYGNDLHFKVGFNGPDGQPLRLKPHDTIRYQYAWGLPDVYPTSEEGLKSVKSGEITPEHYCMAEVEANRGAISQCSVELRFERETSGAIRRELFSKSPFFQLGSSYAKEVEWTPAQRVPPSAKEPEEYDIWYEIYKIDLADFNGKARVLWRPASEKYFE